VPLDRCQGKLRAGAMQRMTARHVVTSERTFRVSGEGYATTGTFCANNMACTAADDPLLLAVLRAAAACNDAELALHDDCFPVIGDPTEAALLVMAAKGGATRQDIEATMPRLGVLPFDSTRKRMTVIRNRGGQPWAFTKGAQR
jgi:P-type Ca2+ transporter type 2C